MKNIKFTIPELVAEKAIVSALLDCDGWKLEFGAMDENGKCIGMVKIESKLQDQIGHN